jgi:serine/threonine-protein kinase
VLIERCGKLTAKVQLFRDEEVGEGMLYIPAGEVILGGDPAAPGALEATRRYVGGFFAGRHPVTFREYCAFLDALREAGDPELAQLIPHTEKEGECVVIGLDRRYRPVVEKLVDLPARRSQPEGFEWRLPVLAVSWFAAARYCEWLSRQSGREVRLLRDAEWEKAARGPARSAHPWGHTFDWSFAKGGLSRAGPPQPEPVESFEADVSIYGVRDLAGTIREWCADWFVDGVARLIRGGAWSSMNPVSFRSAVRSGARPGMKSSAVGFRIAATPARRVGLGLAEGEPVGRLPG